VGRSRARGQFRVGERYGCSDHAAYGYVHEDERGEVARAWLLDGLAAGQRAGYVSDGFDDPAVDRDATLCAARDDGAFVRATTSDLYDLSRPIDAAEQLATYDALVCQALAEGYTGLRVAVDVTPLVADPARRPAHLRWEQLADRYIAEHPVAPLCLFDDRRVQFDAVVHVHPLRDEKHASFGVYGGGGAMTTIEGEVDGQGAEAFAAALESIPASDTVVDLSPLVFADARAASLLHGELARRRHHGHPLAVAGVPASLRRLWDLCQFDPTLLAA
jgi:anti-anti-sigma regulatory factor